MASNGRMSNVLRKAWKTEILSNLGHLLEGDEKNYEKSQSGFRRASGSNPRPFE
jgi:hypothetical protein